MSNTNGALTASSSVVVKDTISLTDKERQIFGKLLQVVHHFNLETQLRVAGGWVRDKLLGKECYDIDIALDNMLGREFCEKVNDYLVSTGEETPGFGVIPSKPHQGKHLETATMRLFDVWIDFVNLIPESNTENGTSPTMGFGPAKQDAYRRDLTINSLFYNINTCLVEDFTGRGLVDLKSGKIVTPLPPKERFLDDPLRVLRAIRFATRFEFEMVDELKVAAADNDVKTAFSDKISRERVGHEIDRMVSGNQPVKAITCLSELGLFWVVFKLPSKYDPSISEEHDRICLWYIDAASRFLCELGSCTMSDEQRRLYLFAALFLPVRNNINGDKKKSTASAVNHVLKNSLKLKTSDAVNVNRLHNAAEKFSALTPFMVPTEESAEPIEVDWNNSDMIDVPSSLKLRILIGIVVHDIKDLWRAALMLSTLLNEDSSFERKIGVYKNAEEEILKLGLEKVWEVQPLINGPAIMKLLKLKHGGPVIGEWRQKLLQWQLAYPSGNVQEGTDWMTKQIQLNRPTRLQLEDTNWLYFWSQTFRLMMSSFLVISHR